MIASHPHACTILENRHDAGSLLCRALHSLCEDVSFTFSCCGDTSLAAPAMYSGSFCVTFAVAEGYSSLWTTKVFLICSCQPLAGY